MVSKSQDLTENQVQDRILDTAERLFCEKGYAETSIRDITTQAKCNVAAVNYHFGKKENLYNRVFQRHLSTLRDVRLQSIKKVMTEENVSLERLLYAFAISFIEPLVDESRGQRFMKLMVREMLDQHLPKRLFADEIAVPTIKALSEAMMSLCPHLNQRQVFMSIISIIGQLVHVIHLRNIFGAEEIERLDVPNLNEMVSHIVRFSTAGIESMNVKESE